MWFIFKQTKINEKIWTFHLEWKIDDRKFVLNININVLGSINNNTK